MKTFRRYRCVGCLGLVVKSFHYPDEFIHLIGKAYQVRWLSPDGKRKAHWIEALCNTATLTPNCWMDGCLELPSRDADSVYLSRR